MYVICPFSILSVYFALLGYWLKWMVVFLRHQSGFISCFAFQFPANKIISQQNTVPFSIIFEQFKTDLNISWRFFLLRNLRKFICKVFFSKKRFWLPSQRDCELSHSDFCGLEYQTLIKCFREKLNYTFHCI